MINIKRDKLLKELIEFSSGGSGLVVGNPGIGKSYILNQLKDLYLDQEILSILIRIDNLVEGTDEEIRQDLNLEGEWIPVLKKIKINDGKKAILIFDAFDAARNEILRSRILKQIQKAKTELGQKWNIIVSVRTYDASKSQKLIELFPLSENYNESVYCRKITIPPLTDEEVRDAVQANSSLLNFFNEGTTALKDILKIPFFLNIADKVILDSTAQELLDLKTMESETQLLKIYWYRKIINTYDHLLKEQLLLQLTKILIGSRSLSCPVNIFIPEVSPDQSSVFEYLRSENILDETTIGDRRISYSHNILFDYAVSILYLSRDVDTLLRFINEEPSRPFFLRPSFVYFFSQLWYDDNATFWKFFRRLYKEEIKEIKLFVRLVLMGVIASAYGKIEDLNPITELADAAEKNILLQNLLQSIRFIRKKTAAKDIDLLEFTSKNLDTPFLWDFGFLLDRAVNETDRLEAKLPEMGEAARNFLSYALNNRKKEHNPNLDRLAATRGVELVCKTYSTNVEESKTLLRLIFNMLSEPDFEIYYFVNLSEYIKDILPFDPGFVAEVYRAIFDHDETSTAKTNMGTGVIMNLTSNRRQDFDMCYYRLTEFFDTFIRASSGIAIQVGIEIVNKYIINDRVNRYMKEGPSQEFELKRKKRIYIADYSSMWANNLTYHKPVTIANKVVDFIVESAAAGEEVTTYLDQFCEWAKVGYTWMLLINTGSRLGQKYAEYFFDFCIEEIFLTSTDTSYETGNLIETDSSFFTNEQIALIEEKIDSIAQGLEKRDPEFFRRRFLSRLPLSKLKKAESKELLEKAGAVENDKPFQSNVTVTPFTTEMWLEERGVNVKDPVNGSLLAEADKIKQFNDQWRNNVPGKDAFELYFDIASNLFEKLKSVKAISDDLLFSILSEIAQTFAIISRNITILDDREFQKLKEAIKYCFNYLSYSDKNVDENASPSHGYSPTPRIIASEALAPIYSREDSAENLAALKEAIQSNNSIVRYDALKHVKLIRDKHRNLFETLIFESLKNENDAFVASIIIQNIPSTPYNEEEANKLLEYCYAKKTLFTFNNAFLDNFSLRAVWLYTTHKNALADKIISDAHMQQEFCRTIIFNVFEDFRMSSLKHFSNSEFFIDSSVRWILHYLNETAGILKKIPETELKDNPLIKSALNLFDIIIQRIFFVFERKQYGNRLVIPISEDNREFLYKKIKPIFEKILLVSSEIPGGGFIIGNTAHYFIQTLRSVLQYDPKEILSMVTQTTKLSFHAGYTFDSFSIREMINLTEKLLADHRELLTEKEPFDNLIQLLDLYMNSGWTEALELLWKLDEIFK